MASTFHTVDYIVFGISLLIPLGIGVFFKIYTRKRQSTSEYLLGGRQMGCLVLGFSLMASFYNAVFLIGAPAETYYFGLIWILKFVPYIFITILDCVLIVPFFRRFNHSTAHEYLESRYKSKIPRFAGAFGFSLHMMSFLAVVMYAPALVFNQVSGLNMNIAIICCGVICAAYTFMGGIKAVLWADAVQTFIILISFAAISAIGILKVGGWDSFTVGVLQSQRVNFVTLDTNLNTRHTLWTQLIGGTFLCLGSSNQMRVQRIVAAKSTKAAQIAYLINACSVWTLAIATAFLGLIVYVYFKDCDPMLAGFTAKPDQVVPYYVMQVLGMHPGIPGCFIAAIFAAALSTVSSMVNGLSLVTTEDFIKPIYSLFTAQVLNDRQALLISKAFTAFYGALSIILAFAAPYMGPVLLQIPVILISCIAVPMNVLFLVSIFWPYTNVWGATSGSLVGLAFGLFLALSKMLHGSRVTMLPVGQCLYMNETAMVSGDCTVATELTSMMYEATDVPITASYSVSEYAGHLSYMWYPVMTWVVTATSCVLISAIAKCFGLSLTDTSYVYSTGLVYYGYKPDKRRDYKGDMDYGSDPVLLTNLNPK